MAWKSLGHASANRLPSCSTLTSRSYQASTTHPTTTIPISGPSKISTISRLLMLIVKTNHEDSGYYSLTANSSLGQVSSEAEELHDHGGDSRLRVGGRPCQGGHLTSDGAPLLRRVRPPPAAATRKGWPRRRRRNGRHSRSDEHGDLAAASRHRAGKGKQKDLNFIFSSNLSTCPFLFPKNNLTLKLIMQRTNTTILFPDASDPNIPPIRKGSVTILGSIHNVYLARQQLIVRHDLSFLYTIRTLLQGF